MPSNVSANPGSGRGGTTSVGPTAESCLFFGVFGASELAVRETMQAITARLDDAGIDRNDRSVAEITLAEVLNNVVEHALAGIANGKGTVRIFLSGAQLRCVVCDNGAPMPGGVPPEGRAASLTSQIKDLAEGGYGWLLINGLSREVRYSRSCGRNTLSFCLPLNGN